MTYILSLTGGILAGISFSPFPLRFLVIVGLFLLLFTAERARRPFIAGFLFGLGYFVSHLWWLTRLVIPVNRLLLFSGLFLMYIYLALYFAILYLFIRKGTVWIAPFALVYLEWVRSLGPLGFPWGYLGYSFTPYTLFTQMASLGGIYMLSFLIMLFVVIAYSFIYKRRLKYLVYLSILMISVLGYGLIRYLPKEKGRRIKIGIVQPNVSPLTKGSREEREKQFRELLSLIEEAGKKGCYMAIIPETATIYTFDREGVEDKFIEIAEKYNMVIAGGTPLFEREKGRWIFYNAAFSLDKEGIEKFYRKNKLVPFSERFPFSDYIPLLEKIDVGGGNFGRGKEFTVFHNAGFNFAILICFESIFPFYVAGFNDVDLLINVTNDGWFLKTPGPYQHAEMSIIRAIERGVPLVRSANNGISMYVDTRGRVVKKTDLFVKDLLIVDVTLAKRFTIFPYGGYLMILLSLLGTLYFLTKDEFHKIFKKC